MHASLIGGVNGFMGPLINTIGQAAGNIAYFLPVLVKAIVKLLFMPFLLLVEATIGGLKKATDKLNEHQENLKDMPSTLAFGIPNPVYWLLYGLIEAAKAIVYVVFGTSSKGHNHAICESRNNDFDSFDNCPNNRNIDIP
jgi:hypothetical protein